MKFMKSNHHPNEKKAETDKLIAAPTPIPKPIIAALAASSINLPEHMRMSEHRVCMMREFMSFMFTIKITYTNNNTE
jgi:hypothetical protein